MLLALLVTFNACKKDKEEGSPKIEPRVTGYYPNSGKAGTLVTIEGEGFGTSIGDYSAAINGKSADVISVTANSVVVRVPDGATGNLTLKAGNKPFEVGIYTYQDLSVKNVFPANGPAGAQIRITGEGFSSVNKPAAVLINNVPALVVSIADTLIVAEVPNDAGFGPITVKVDGKEASGRNFTYQAINTMKPLTGGVNTRVVLTGVGFETTLANNKVDFNGKTGTVVEATDKQLIVLAPAGVASGPLSITINGQKITGQTFTVVGSPVIGTVSPLSGPKGTEMTIQGDAFSTVLDENKVFINNVQVPIKSVTPTQIKLTIPGGTGSGNVRVVVNDQATNGPAFKDQTLGIIAISPDNGLAGSTVTITGTGFSATPSENKVFFNGVQASVKTATESTLVLDAPANVTTGAVKVIVDNVEATSPQPFRRAGVITVSNAIDPLAQAIAIDSHDNIYVSNPADGKVKKITPAGVVTNLQANGIDIQFTYPRGITIDSHDNIYVADQNASQIRKITPSGQNTVVTSGFQPSYINFDNAGNIYAAVNGFAAGMKKVFPAGNYSTVNGPNWVGTKPVFDATGNMYFSDQNLDAGNGVEVLRAIDGRTQIFVGGAYDDAGFVDGTGRGAKFYGITSMTLSKPNELTVTDNLNRAIRLVNISTGAVTTLAKFTNGFADGTLATAKFVSLTDLAIGKDGSIYVLDAGNNAIRKIFLQ